MKKIKAQQLTQLLKAAEQQELSGYLHQNKKPVLAKLFDSLCIHKSKGAAAIWFTDAFDESYTDEKDYLLRNELRHLSNELIRYLVQKELAGTKHNAQAETYLKVLTNRKATTELFDTELQRLLRQAEEDNNVDALHKLRLLQIDYTLQTAETTPANYQQILQHIDGAVAALKSQFELSYLQLWRKRVTVQRTLKAMGQELEIEPVKTVNFNWTLTDETPINLAFLLLQMQATQSAGNSKVQLLQQAATLIPQLNFIEANKPLEEASCAAAIALEYFLMGEYEASMPYHAKALSFSNQLDNSRLQPFLFNYLATLIRMERYNQAVELLEQHSPVWLKSKKLKDRTLCMKAMCHLFLNETDAAANCLPEQLKDNGLDHYYYYRVIQTMVFYQRGDVMLAINEAENFLDTIKYQSVDDDHKELVLLLRRYFKLQNEKVALSKDKFQEQLTDLQTDYDSLLKEKAHPHNYLLYKWTGGLFSG